MLWLRIRINCAKDDAEIRDLLRKPEFSALKRLSEGSVSVFKEIMSLLEKHELWEDLFSISQELFDQGLAYLVDDADGSLGDIAPAEDEIHERMQNILSFTTVRAQELGEAKKEAESRAFQTAVMDWSLWKQFIAAASHLKTDKK